MPGSEGDRPIEVASANGRLPDFFIAGHAKCGTTALYEMLRRHPQIYMPELKEPYFFAGELSERAATSRSGALPGTLDEYAALFSQAAPDQRVGEASAYYLWSHDAVRRIAALCPEARLIGIFREPASFLRSLHLQFVQDHHECEKSLRKALALEPRRREGKRVPRSARWPSLLMYSEHVNYSKQLERLNACFSQDQLLILVYDDMRNDNQGTMRTILRFLGVDDREPVEAIDANPTVRTRSQRLDDLVHTVSVGRGRGPMVVKGAVKTVMPRRVRRRALTAIQRNVVHAPPGTADERTMTELRERYKHEVMALGNYLKRDLVSLWGYESLG
jgi:hypothetical protein